MNSITSQLPKAWHRYSTEIELRRVYYHHFNPQGKAEIDDLFMKDGDEFMIEAIQNKHIHSSPELTAHLKRHMSKVVYGKFEDRWNNGRVFR